MRRPTPAEYHAFYAGNVCQVQEGPVIEMLQAQIERWDELLDGPLAGRGDYRYAPGKWSVKEMLGHVADAERIFSYRACCIARRDTAPLPGMDQDVYAANTDFARRTMASLRKEFRHQRLANIELFGSFDDSVADCRGTASGCEFTVRALVYIVAGHAEHHFNQLKLRYLS